MGIVPTPESDRARFWAKVEKTPDCWLWTAVRFSNGYGAFRLDRKQCRAHVVAHEWLVGPTNGLLVCHACDVKHCVRPDHLFLGTQEDNIRDAVSKQRMATGVRSGMHTHDLTAVTEAQVREIYDRYRAGASQYDLADQFGISQTGVSKILRGVIWKHLGLVPILHQTLSDQDALEIRRRLAEGEHRLALAKRFDVSVSAIDKINHRRTFRHLPEVCHHRD
jgi:hypothetical protein